MKEEEVKATIKSFCSRHGISDDKRAEIEDGFDLHQPLVAYTLYPPEELFQYIRLPSSMNVCPSVGNWFALKGATLEGVAIFSGLSGRRRAKFELLVPIEVLEGTAGRQPRDWDIAVGGPGGSTQLYIPTASLVTLRCWGNVEP